MGEQFGNNPSLHKRVQVEFVSANPTGNLHMGNARGGALGDTLANVLARAGYDVEREFYINDCGNQIEVFGQSLEARYLQLMGQNVAFPENGYAGQDVVDTVKAIIGKYNNSLLELSSEARQKKMIEYALDEKITYIKSTMNDFGINYDVWFSEKTLHETGKIDEIIAFLKAHDYIYESEGALWFKTTLFGDEKDEVLVRANGIPTYFAADIAYHKDKFERGFDWVINVWGADHHGQYSYKGALEAIVMTPQRLDNKSLCNGKAISRRTDPCVCRSEPNHCFFDELIEEVGKDATRFFFVMRSPDSHLDFDMELAKQQSQENPVYYVQYAHARIMSIFRQAQAAGAKIKSPGEIDFSILGPEELQLLRKIADFPEEIAIADRTLSSHFISSYLLYLAGLFHSFYNHNRVLNEDKSLQDARLVVMESTRIAIKNALDILGVSAPEQM